MVGKRKPNLIPTASGIVSEPADPAPMPEDHPAWPPDEAFDIDGHGTEVLRSIQDEDSSTAG